MEESELLARARQGDQEAFGLLVEPHRGSLQRLCYKMTGSHEDAEDLVQDTFVRAFSAIGSFEGRAALGTWLHRIATNLCLDHQRHRPPWREERRWQWFEDNKDVLPMMEQTLYMQPDQILEAKEVAATCLNCMGMTLPAKQRAALVLCDQLGFHRQEAADMIGCSVASVKTELHRARMKMTDIYAGHCALMDQKNECNACVTVGIAARSRRAGRKEPA
jgi:RNA polymerase sigma factor (sigma-70 family)